MTRSSERKSGCGWCGFGANVPFAMGSTGEMDEMAKKFCGEWCSLNCLPMMGMFRNEDDSFDWDRMMEMMRKGRL